MKAFLIMLSVFSVCGTDDQIVMEAKTVSSDVIADALSINNISRNDMRADMLHMYIISVISESDRKKKLHDSIIVEMKESMHPDQKPINPCNIVLNSYRKLEKSTRIPTVFCQIFLELVLRMIIDVEQQYNCDLKKKILQTSSTTKSMIINGIKEWSMSCCRVTVLSLEGILELMYRYIDAAATQLNISIQSNDKNYYRIGYIERQFVAFIIKKQQQKKELHALLDIIFARHIVLVEDIQPNI